MLIENIGEQWSEGTNITQNEGWQCREGSVLVSVEATGPDGRGVRLDKGEAWPFPQGSTVYYRRLSGPGATISREPIA